MKFNSSSFLILCLVSYAGNSSYSLMIPLYPPLASQKGLNEQEIGYVLCLYPVGQFLMSWILGNFMKNNAKKSCMIVGLILQTLGMLGFGILKQINDQQSFIQFSCIFRLLTGIGAGFLFTPSYSLVGYLFQDNIHQALSLMEFISGISMFSSPLLGSVFYYLGEKFSIGGYSMPFYFMSLTYILIIPLVSCYLSVERQNQIETKLIELQVIGNQENQSFQELQTTLIQHQNVSKNESNLNPLSYSQIMKIPEVVITYICFCLTLTSQIGIRTYLAQYLQIQYLLSGSLSVFFFTMFTFSYSIAAALAGFSKKINREKCFIIGMLLTILGSFLYGPDTQLTNFPKQLRIVFLADLLTGIACGLLCSIIIPQFVIILLKHFPDKEEKVDDLSSALFISSWSLAEFAGPLLVGLLNEHFHFERAASLMGMSLLLPLFFYYKQLFL